MADDFDDFCIRASKLADESNGAPLFTVAHIHSLPKPISCSDGMDDCSGFREDDSFDVVSNKGAEGYEHEHEDDWQLLWKLNYCWEEWQHGTCTLIGLALLKGCCT